jgi:cytochrome c553
MSTRPILIATALLGASPAWAQAPAQPASVATCAACHGARGEGNPAQKAPRLAAQSPAYLLRQLKLYADGTRNNPVMTPIAKGLSEQDRQAAADYYAAVSAPTAKPPASSASAQAGRARQLATVGDERRRIQACSNCHGPSGTGEPPTYPYIAGQQQAYLQQTLEDWRRGTRKTDPSGQMSSLAASLTPGDVTALAAYFARLAPPGPVRANVPSSAGPAPAPAAKRGGNEARGTGTEQEGPTTGGSQGNAPAEPSRTPPGR